MLPLVSSEYDNALFCASPGCMAIFKVSSTDPYVMKLEAEAAGWHVDQALNRSFCPVHRGEDGVPALVPSIPPTKTPGVFLVSKPFVQPIFRDPDLIPSARPRVLVGV